MVAFVAVILSMVCTQKVRDGDGRLPVSSLARGIRKVNHQEHIKGLVTQPSNLIASLTVRTRAKCPEEGMIGR